MRFAVAVEGEVTTRAAQSLSTHPGFEVVILAPATSTQFQVVDSPEGCGAVLGADLATAVARDADLPVVTTGRLAGQPGVSWASIEGLALALAAGMDRPTVAVAVPGEPAGEETVVFPSPIDGRPVRKSSIDGREVRIGYGNGRLASALALAPELHRVVLDEHRFLEAIALAAGAALVAEEEIADAVPVWQRPEPYLRTAATMGMVVGERVPM